MIHDIARPVALEVWKDPQNFVITHHVRDEVWVYFRCWETAGEDARYIGCLHFEGVWHLDSSRFSMTRGYPNIMETDLRSYYLVIDDSNLLKTLTAERSRHDPGWEKYDRRQYKHYIVESHDFYINIVAGKVSFATIEGSQTKLYFDVWNNA